jgi:ELWxxDGT repeat protein
MRKMRVWRGRTNHTNRPAARIQSLESRMLLAASAELVKDIIAGSQSSAVFNQGFFFGDNTEVALGNKFIFTATDGQHGVEPWVSDGTAEGTILLKDINAGAGTSQAAGFTVFGSFVYFFANDGTSWQIWRSDGTAANTVRLTNIAAGADAGHGVGGIAFSSGKIFYEESGSVGCSLWVSDGITQGSMIKDFPNQTPSEGPVFQGAVGGQLFFSMIDGNDVSQVWISDGTSIGTGPLTNFPDDSAEFSLNNIFNGHLVFSAFVSTGNNGGGDSLFETTGDNSTTGHFGPLFQSSGPDNFTVSGGKLYFTAVNTIDQIYSYDGLTVAPVSSLGTTSDPDAIENLTDVNGTLFFTADVSGETQLYKLVSGAATPVPLPSGASDPSNLQSVNGTLFFSASDAGSATLFETDGSTTAAVEGDPGNNPTGLLNVDGTLFYAASDSTHGTELHTATPTGTTSELNLDIGHNVDIDQGDRTVVTYRLRLSGGTAKYIYWDLTGKGYGPAFRAPAGMKVGLSYAKYSTGVRAIRCLVKTTDGREVSERVLLTIHNVAPTLTITQSSHVTVPYLPVTFTANITDPGVNDSFTVDWNFGDGTPVVTQDVGTARTATMSHTFKTHLTNFVATKEVTVGVLDQNNGRDTESASVQVRKYLINREKNGIQLVIGGVPGEHEFTLAPNEEGGASGVTILLDGVVLESADSGISEILIAASPTDTVVNDLTSKAIQVVIRGKKTII